MPPGLCSYASIILIQRFYVLSEQAVSSHPCLGYSPQVNILYMSVLRKQDMGIKDDSLVNSH